MVRAQLRGQTGARRVKKERMWAVQSGKSELQGPVGSAQCLCFYSEGNGGPGRGRDLPKAKSESVAVPGFKCRSSDS